jgi:hypothetical protein
MDDCDRDCWACAGIETSQVAAAALDAVVGVVLESVLVRTGKALTEAVAQAEAEAATATVASSSASVE